MEFLLWLAYWREVLVTCFNWTMEFYPIPTLIIGVLITGATVMGFIFIGKREEAHNIVLTFIFGLAACVLVFLGLVLVWGPYIHLQQHERDLEGKFKAQYEIVEQSKSNDIKALNETMASLRGDMVRLQEKLHGAQHDNEKRNSFILELCSTENLRFKEKQIHPPLPYDGNMAYAKQVEVWPNFNLSQDHFHPHKC